MNLKIFFKKRTHLLNTVLSIMLIICLIILYLFQYKYQECSTQINTIRKQYISYKRYNDKILGKSINQLSFVNLQNHKSNNLYIKRGLIFWGSTLGCGKCIESLIVNYIKYKNKIPSILVLQSKNISEFSVLKKINNKMHDIYWDNKLLFDSHFKIDLERSYPIVTYLENNIIVSYLFIDSNYQKEIEIMLTNYLNNKVLID